jgi:hypothetical protein
MVTGRHHEIGWPGDAPAQSLQYRRGTFRNAIPLVASCWRVAQARSDPVTAIGKAPRGNSRPRQRVKNPQQAWFGNAREIVELMKRRIRLHLQGLHDAQPALEGLYRRR